MNKQTLKAFDLAVVSLLKLIKDCGIISQVELSKLSGYSRSTVSINCDKLLSNGYIVIDDNKNIGQKKNIGLRLNKNLGYVIGIGMGGSNCRIAMCDIEGTLLHLETLPVDLMCGPEPTLELICPCIDALLKKNKDIDIPLCGIGMGIPSPVKYETGVAFHPAFMPGWHLYPVKEYLQSRYHCPTFIDNEVNTLALGEYTELQEPHQVLLCVKVGTGIGAGIIINRSIYRGENGGSGNIGHIQIDENTTPCVCGKIGCIEAIASLPALENQAVEIAKNYPQSILAEIYNKSDHISISDIRHAADKGDRFSLGIIQEAGTHLGNLLGKLIIFLDPGKIVIAGRTTLLGPIYLDYIRKATLKESAPWIGANFAIEFSKLKEDSSAIGAALLCIDELFDHQLIFNSGML